MSDPRRDDDQSVHPISRRLSFLDGRMFRNRVGVALGLAALGLAAVDLFHHRHEIFEFEGVIGFYALFGFLAFGLVVLSGWPLRDLLGKPETYYRGDDEDA